MTQHLKSTPHKVKGSGSPKPVYPDVKVHLTPTMSEDRVLGTMGNALHAANFTQDDINIFYDAARRGDYNHLIAVCKRWVTITGV